MRFLSKLPVARLSRLRVPQGGAAFGVFQRAANLAKRTMFAHGRQPLITAGAILGVAIHVAAGATYISHRSNAANANERAASEASSFAAHSGWLATGDAFGGYIQLLRYADDGAIRSKGTPSDLRTAALRKQLELNTNRFSNLAVVTFDGQVVAATDGTMLDAVAGAAYGTVRANQGNANSDIILPGPGISPYVDYASVLIDPDGEKWAVLIARGDPTRLWQSTLSAAIDGGRNVIINREGQMVAGVAAEGLGADWRGSEFVGGTIRARIDGVESICGLSAIASNTQIDHGWNVGSCLPAATVVAGTGFALIPTLLTLAVAMLAAVVAIGLLFVLAPTADPVGAVAVASLEPETEPDPEPVVEIAVEAIVPPNINARHLIGAYEARNARLALRIRESVQARLLVASSRVDEAIELHDDDPALARVMLERASHELDDLNGHELRAMGQELYPDLVRLGLPAALRALKKDISDDMDVDIDTDGESDSLDEESERAIGPGLRVVMYRFVLDTLRQFEEGGLRSCSVTLRRAGTDLWLAVRGHGDPARLGPPLDATVLAIEAYSGIFRLDLAGDSAEAVAEFGDPDAPNAVPTDPPAEIPAAEDLDDETMEASSEAEIEAA